MAQDDLTQWIAEVRTLQRQLTDTQQERDQAHTSAANWRRLYETEARQRREEVAGLKAELDALRQDRGVPDTAEALAAVDSLQSLQQQLDGLVLRCQDLTDRLAAEQAAHAHTRQTLTAALGDTFDALK